MIINRLFSKLLLLTFFFALFGCASINDIGYKHYLAGNYEQAAYLWGMAAKQGDATAQNNMGVLWEHGYYFEKNDTRAAEWFVLSAQNGYVPAMVHAAKMQLRLGYYDAAKSWLALASRWGNPEAKQLLTNLGQAVTESDLYYQQQAQQAQYEAMAAGMMIQSMGNMGHALGCAAAGGCRPAVPVYTPSVNSVKPDYQRRSNTDFGCTSDFDCGSGQSCAKAPFNSTGTCMTSVDSYGVKTIQPPQYESIGVNTNPQCDSTGDCGPGFTCDIFLKVCVSR
ncbi:hypothetical protein GCM10022414_27550 [Zhongshania borealis]|uniref:Sel1 repeat family protein n=2 Tax=Zhongshania borealis TaxID=889488 RepID=A0ABP7WZA2_9GAMM